MKTLISFLFVFTSLIFVHAGGYQVGDKAVDFKLKNVNGKFVSLSDYNDAKGFIVIFTCNHCPFAKAYQDRIQEIDKIYKPKGFPVIAINPNDPKIVPEDSFEAMVKLSNEKAFTYPYLIDEKQEVYRLYGATRTPHVYLLKKVNKEWKVAYIGAIDDNHQDVKAVKEKYLINALEAIIAGKKPEPEFTKAIGCSIKDNALTKATP